MSRHAAALIAASIALAASLSPTDSVADSGGALSGREMPSTAGNNQFNGDIFRPSPYGYDDRNAPKGIDAPYNSPVAHPARPLNIYLIPPAYAFNAMTFAERKVIQEKLLDYGYYNNRIDGVWGPSTYQALIAYSVDLKIEDRLSTMASTLSLFQHIAS